MSNDESKYKKIIESLGQLKKVEAPSNFEADLMRKINNPQPQQYKSLWDIIFSPGRLIPSAALVATAVILIFVVKNNSTELEDPFSINPRMREDILVSKVPLNISYEPVEGLEKKKEVKEKLSSEQKTFQKDNASLNEIESVDSPFSAKSDGQLNNFVGSEADIITPFEETESDSISKSNLNFKQIKLTDSSKEEIAKLKENVSKFLNPQKNLKRKNE